MECDFCAVRACGIVIYHLQFTKLFIYLSARWKSSTHHVARIGDATCVSVGVCFCVFVTAAVTFFGGEIF